MLLFEAVVYLSYTLCNLLKNTHSVLRVNSISMLQFTLKNSKIPNVAPHDAQRSRATHNKLWVWNYYIINKIPLEKVELLYWPFVLRCWVHTQIGMIKILPFAVREKLTVYSVVYGHHNQSCVCEFPQTFQYTTWCGNICCLYPVPDGQNQFQLNIIIYSNVMQGPEILKIMNFGHKNTVLK